jgi:RNA polymerase sigma-70 factor (ECF subfamily)
MKAAPQPLSALATALAEGAVGALGDWYEAERTPVYRLCLGFLACAATAEDAAQEALLRLADRIHRWDRTRPYEPWRNSVVLNLCRDRQRSDQRREARERQGAAAETGLLPDPAEQAEAGELREALGRALSHLPPREREVFVLADLCGRPTEELTAELGLTASTVRATLSLARRRLQEALAPRLPERFRVRPGGLS